jgi:hypothetical protein
MLNMGHLWLKRVLRMALTTLIRTSCLLSSRRIVTLLIRCKTGETYWVGQMIGKYHEDAKAAGMIVSLLSSPSYDERVKGLLTSQSFYLRLGFKVDRST